MKNEDKIIVDLCAGTGEWSLPYEEAGYKVIRVTLPNMNVLDYMPPKGVYGILAAPPCNCFCRPGARWWSEMDMDGRTEEAVKVFTRCFILCQRSDASFWALENPPGRHRKLMTWLPRPSFQFSPYLYGHPWKKQTYLWGKFNLFFPSNIVKPEATVRAPSGHTQGRIAYLGSANSVERSRTPPNFAKAFFEANQ